MADENSVGSVFLDLILRDHTEKQIQQAAETARRSSQRAFDGVEQSAQKAASAISGSMNRAVAMAQAKLNELNRAHEAVTAKLDEQWNKGSFDPSKAATGKLVAQQERLMVQIESARERLQIQMQLAAEKQAAVEERAAQKAAAAEERAANRRKAIHASMWKNMLSKAGAGAKSILGKLTGIGKGYNGAGKAAGRFGSRLREIASGALIFNGISMALRKVVSYFGKSIAASDQMQAALANLKGAAANAASPMIQVLTPALTALANAAATVFSYVAQLMTALTGKVSRAASTVTKGAGAAKKAMASLAGFDEIQKLEGKDSGSDGGSETVAPNYGFKGKSPFLDQILESVKAGQWGRVGSLIAQKLNDSLAAVDWAQLGRTLTGGLRILYEAFHGFVEVFDFKSFGADLAQMVTAGIGNINWVQLAVDLMAGLAGLMDLCSGFIQEIDWSKLGSELWNGLTGVITGIDWLGLVWSAFELLGSVIGGAAALFEGLCTSIHESLKEAWNSTVSYFDTFIDEAGGNIIEGLWNGIIAALSNAGQWIKDNIFQPFIDGFKEAFGIHSPSTVMEEQGGFIIDGLLGGITAAWEKVKTFFDTALSDVETKLSDAFESIKTTVSDIWKNGIVPAIKGPINAIISCINAMISGVVTGINTMVRALNRIHFDIPAWVPGMGGKSFGFHLSELSAPQIPMLAKGGVIKQPTLAMMGEYSGARNNPEIVAPQAIIEETVANVMGNLAQINAMGFEQIIALLREILEAILGIEIDGETISRAVENYKRKMAVAKGGA